MSFQGQLYVDLAEELIKCCKADHINEEAYFRSSVSRSYYGVFLIARQVMEQKGRRLSSRGAVHQQVQNYFLNSNDNLKKKIGEELKYLRIQRNKADYDLMSRFDKLRAEKVCKRAKKTLVYLLFIL